MRSYRNGNKLSNLKYTIADFLGKNKLHLIVLIFFAVLGLFTGVFTAIKCGGVSTGNLQSYNLSIFSNGSVFSFNVFFSRMLSHVAILTTFSITTVSVFLMPVTYIIHIYKGYLIGFNCTLLLMLFGFTGTITSIIIILPCQLLVTAITILFICLMIDRSCKKKKYGMPCKPHFLKIFFLFLFILTIINIIETLLLILLSAKTILVI